jgi:hypothetical protein
MPLRASTRQSLAQVNRLTVVAGKSGVPAGFGYGAEKYQWRDVMSDSIATARHPVENSSGEMAMSRLADRLAAMAPPPVAANLAPPPTFRPSPAVAAALSTSAAIAARADQRARRSRSVIGMMVDSFVSACTFIPYALVALGLRLVMARVFFLDGQADDRARAPRALGRPR